MAIIIEYEGITKPIRANSLQFGVGRGISMEAGAIEAREPSNPSMSEITFNKKADETTVELFKESYGKHPRKVLIKMVHEDSNLVYMTFAIEGTYISGYSFSAYESEIPQETISLNFSKIQISHFSEDGSNSLNAGYDLEKAQEINF